MRKGTKEEEKGERERERDTNKRKARHRWWREQGREEEGGTR
jgi:hypothetical protein